jgi:hypothetical protein
MYQFGGKNYKYRTFFESFARTIPPIDKNKVKLAIASLNSLTGIFDEEVLERIRQNPDLLAVSSCLVLADHSNLNGDCVLKEQLLQIAKNFEYKFYDSEHDRASCIGVIDEVGWALYPSNELIDEDQVASEVNPVQLVVGGYLWRVVAPELCNLIEEASNENSPNYQKISKSFELLFNDYWVCVSPDRNAKNPNARLIAPEDEDFAKYDKKLRANGGDGKDGGMLVFRVLRDGILPVGAGIVRNPASGIKGIAVVGPNSEVEKEDMEEVESISKLLMKGFEKDAIQDSEHLYKIKKRDGSIHDFISANIYFKENNGDLSDIMEVMGFSKNLEIAEKCKSISENSVNENKSLTNTIMVISSINDIEAQYDAFTKLPAKEATASIQKIMEAKILELSEKHAAEQKAKDEALASETKAKADLEARASNLGKAVEALQKQLDEITAKQSAAANEAAFNSRMAALDEVFDLDDEDRAILVDEVKALESEAAFMPWMDKKKKLMKEKTKAYKAEKSKCMAKKLTEAGVKFTLDEATLDVKEIFASVKADPTEAKIPNTPHITENLADKLKVLREGTVVAGIKTE